MEEIVKDNKIEFMLDEEKKVTIKSNEEAFSMYLLGIVKNNPEYKKGLSLLDLLSDVMDLYVGSESYRPTLDNPLRVNIRVHGAEKGVEDHTLFGFYHYVLDQSLSTALFDEEITEMPKEAIQMIEENAVEMN